MEVDSVLLRRQRQLYLIFKMAIESEQAAQVRYKQAQEFCDDPDLKKILQTIAKEEAGHEKQLLRWYAQIKKQIGDE